MTAAVVIALAIVLIVALFWTEQGRDLLQSANDSGQGIWLFTGLTVSLLLLEGLVIMIVKKGLEDPDIDRFVEIASHHRLGDGRCCLALYRLLVRGYPRVWIGGDRRNAGVGLF